MDVGECGFSAGLSSLPVSCSGKEECRREGDGEREREKAEETCFLIRETREEIRFVRPAFGLSDIRLVENGNKKDIGVHCEDHTTSISGQYAHVTAMLRKFAWYYYGSETPS